MWDLQPKMTEYASEDRTWLGSAHGFEATDDVTLDADLFAGALGLTDGRILSGTVIGIVTASGLGGPYDSGAGDGRETAVGVLQTTVPAMAGGRINAPIQTQGVLVAANMPHAAGAAGGLDAGGTIADLAQFEVR